MCSTEVRGHRPGYLDMSSRADGGILTTNDYSAGVHCSSEDAPIVVATAGDEDIPGSI